MRKLKRTTTSSHRTNLPIRLGRRSSLSTVSFQMATGMEPASRSSNASSKMERSPSSRSMLRVPLKSTDRLLKATSCSFTHRVSRSSAAVSETELRLSKSSKSASARLSAKLRWLIIQCSSLTVLSTIRLRTRRISFSLSLRLYISRKSHLCADSQDKSTALARRASAVAGNELSFTGHVHTYSTPVLRYSSI